MNDCMRITPRIDKPIADIPNLITRDLDSCNQGPIYVYFLPYKSLPKPNNPLPGNYQKQPLSLDDLRSRP